MKFKRNKQVAKKELYIGFFYLLIFVIGVHGYIKDKMFSEEYKFILF